MTRSTGSAGRWSPLVQALRTMVPALLLLAVAPRVSHAQSAPPPRDSVAWNESMALAAQGDLAGARRVIVETFGERPATYAACARLALLSLMLHRHADAVFLFRLARELPGALPEATAGMGIALSLHGYDELARGAYANARADWTTALQIDPQNADARRGVAILGGARGTGAEASAALIHSASASSDAQMFYLNIAVRIDEARAFRFAARQLTGPTFNGTVGTGAFAAQSELYAGLTRDAGIVTTEVNGFLVAGSGRTGTGAAGSLRIGGRVGAQGAVALFGLEGGTNVQVAPAIYLRALPHVMLSAGARYTHDEVVSAVSPFATVSVRTPIVSLDVTGHAGTERWAFGGPAATILSFLDATKHGVGAALGVRITPRVQVTAQAQLEETVARGTFRSVGLGLRMVPR